MEFPKRKMLALFELADIAVDSADELPNNYWPRTPNYQDLRDASPWWLVHTEFGMVRIGWRKRVISIEWERTAIRCEVTKDEVTKSDVMVHAWSYGRAVEYLTELKRAWRRAVAEAAEKLRLEESPADKEGTRDA